MKLGAMRSPQCEMCFERHSTNPSASASASSESSGSALRSACFDSVSGSVFGSAFTARSGSRITSCAASLMVSVSALALAWAFGADEEEEDEEGAGGCSLLARIGSSTRCSSSCTRVHCELYSNEYTIYLLRILTRKTIQLLIQIAEIFYITLKIFT